MAFNSRDVSVKYSNKVKKAGTEPIVGMKYNKDGSYAYSQIKTKAGKKLFVDKQGNTYSVTKDGFGNNKLTKTVGLMSRKQALDRVNKSKGKTGNSSK